MVQRNSFRENFIGKSSLSKTLKNELIPIGATEKYIEEYGIITEDDIRAENYKEAKNIIDDFHRYFINKSLISFKSEWEEMFRLMERSKTDKEVEKLLKEIKKIKRKEINNCFKEQQEYEHLFDAKLITKLLPEFILTNSEYSTEEKEYKLDIIGCFNKFTTYFTGFHENRKNIYTSDDVSTSVAYRVVDDNSKIFLENLATFRRINRELNSEVVNIEVLNEELLEGWKLEQIFTYEYYNFLLIQSSIDQYNNVCGVINSHINEYCQKNNLNKKSYKMKKLHKQILSITSSFFEIPEKFENDGEVYETVNQLIDEIKSKNILDRMKELVNDCSRYDLSKIYISGKSYTTVSKVISDDWSVIASCLTEYYNAIISGKGEKKEEKVRKAVNADTQKSLAELNELFDCYYNNQEGVGSAIDITSYFEKVYEYVCGINVSKLVYDDKINLIENEEQIAKIKKMLDCLQDAMHWLKPFAIETNVEKDVEFYSEFDEIYEELRNVIPVYNKVRNYATQKPFSKEKIKLNFAIPTLANGWDKNKEYENNAMIFIKDGLYYLGIYNAKNKPAKTALNGSSKRKNVSDYKKMVYKLLPGPNKMLPKVFLSKKGIEAYKPSKYILEGYAKGKHKKGEKGFDLEFCHKLIDFFKESIDKHPDWKNFGFVFSDTNQYADISEFYREVAEQGYKITFEYVSEEAINDLISNGQLYFFQIYNKDFAKGKTGKDNLHTMYWKNIFSEENLKDVVIKLNGEAEIFYRKASIKKPYVHKKGDTLLNKKLKDGTPIEESVYIEILDYINNDCKGSLSKVAQEIYPQTSHFEATMDIVKDRRYSVDKFFFHVPITINYKAQAKENLNDIALKYIANNSKDMHVIGIDRGERNLIYVSVIDSKGNIKWQKSYNIVGNYDYQKKLSEKEHSRDEARKNWKEIGKIAELKEGYLSQVIHEITKLMLEYNAIVVMENLNAGFKRGRFKVERQVYQKFEKMLIDKLNYLVIKEEKVDEPGGLLKGYQLAYPVDNLEKLGKQCGMIFYVPAAFTSKIDPTTGFVDVFKFKEITSGKTKKEFLTKFDEIKYDSNKDMFKFTFDYSKFDTYQTVAVTNWDVYTNGERIVKKVNKANGHISEEVVQVTDKLKEVMDKAQINYANEHNIIEDIENMDERQQLSILNSIVYYFKLAVQMRNSKTSDADYDKIISPVINSRGEFFVTDKNWEEKTSDDICGKIFPADADANGAYNIALKGLYEIQQIKDNWIEGEGIDKDVLKLTNNTWFDYIQNRRFEE